MKKQAIGFHRANYENALSQHHDKLAALQRLKDEFNKLAPLESEAELLKNPIAHLESCFMKANPDVRALGFKFLQVLQLREISLAPFQEAMSDFRTRAGSLKQPDKEAFTIWANNENQVELHAKLEALCNETEHIAQAWPQYSFTPLLLVNVFRGALILQDSKLTPNAFWISTNVK
jgi:hypothetical protein